MKRNLIAAVLLPSALIAGYATPSVGQEIDFNGYGEHGIVESVREIPLGRDRLTELLEHSYQPETGAELTVRLDDGRAITILQKAMQRFEPGERVLVMPTARGAQAERC